MFNTLYSEILFLEIKYKDKPRKKAENAVTRCVVKK
jgi:hypothetical protein